MIAVLFGQCLSVQPNAIHDVVLLSAGRKHGQLLRSWRRSIPIRSCLTVTWCVLVLQLQTVPLAQHPATLLGAVNAWHCNRSTALRLSGALCASSRLQPPPSV